MSKDALSHIRDLPQTVTERNFGYRDYPLTLVYLDRDRLYTEVNDNLLVFLINDLTSPIASYPLNGQSFSCLVSENRLYINGGSIMHVFEVSTSLTEPLVEVSQIIIAKYVMKIVREGSELLLGRSDGSLSVLDIESCKITHNHHFKEISSINDIIALDASHFLVGTD
jgi:hypothetical protein